jgi:asparagine synthase (glutamine-hydrolysing)
VVDASGVDGLAALDGAFVAAIWDELAETLTLVNDRFGLYPHYWTHQSNGFVFAPELRSVLAAPGVRRSHDPVAVAQYVRFQQILGDRTWCDGVSTLRPGTILRYERRSGRVQQHRYWQWSDIRPLRVADFDEAVEETSRRFSRAVHAMTAAPQTGLYLTGGLDGRVILAFAPPDAPMTTITYGASGCRDVVYAERLARAARRRHTWVPLEDGRWVIDHAAMHLALTEGFHSWIHAHGISTCRHARRHFDVALSGWEGGTVLGGSIDFYRDGAYRTAPTAAALTDAFYHGLCHRFTWPGLSDEEAAALWSPAVRSAVDPLPRESLADEIRQVTTFPPQRHADYFYLHNVVRRSLQMHVVTLRGWLDVRCPYFVYDLGEFVYGLPNRFRTTPRLRRAVLTRQAPRLAWIPYEKDACLPHENVWIAGTSRLVQRGAAWMRRQGVPIPERPRLYADYEEYLRTDLRQWAEPLLLGPSTMTREWFNHDQVAELWHRHLAGRQKWTNGKIAPLMTLEMVCREIVGQPLPTLH